MTVVLFKGFVNLLQPLSMSHSHKHTQNSTYSMLPVLLYIDAAYLSHPDTVYSLNGHKAKNKNKEV